jgi:outer membrane lipoprotein-sorting protein
LQANWKTVATFLALLVVPIPGTAQDEAPPISEVIARVRQLYSRQCCFRASFDQVTVNVAMDLKDRFDGMMYVKRPGMIALEVENPEKQQVAIRGRSYAVYFPADGSAVRGEVPPEMNIEHFFGFLANIEDLEKNFAVSYPAKATDPDEHLIFVELTDRKNPLGAYRIMVGIDMNLSLIRRAIIYDALGNYNRFELSDIVFLSQLPDSRFQIAPIPTDRKEAPSP